MLPIGVDLGSQVLKIAQLQESDGNTELIASGSAVLTGGDNPLDAARLAGVTKQLRQLIRQGRFRGRECVVSIPAAATFVHHIKIPKSAPGGVLPAIRAELGNKLPYPMGQTVMRHVIAGEAFGEGDPKQEVIVICARRSEVEALAKAVRKAGLSVESVNIEPCAIVECFARLFRRASDSSRTILFVDVGATTTQVVFSQGSRIVFARNLTMGGQAFDDAAAKNLELSVEQVRQQREALARGQEVSIDAEQLYTAMEQPTQLLTEELMHCLRYYESVFRNQGIERSIFVGGQAYDRRLCQMIARKLNLPAQIGDPLVRIARSEGTTLTSSDPLPNWAVAVGLSLGGNQAA
jgi:type IV pilus assembly protein PilM